MAQHIQFRRDTRANWESQNPVMLEGEMGLVLDDPNLYKVGDGVTEWNDLPYRGYNGNTTESIQDSSTSVPMNKAVYNRTNLNLSFDCYYINNIGYDSINHTITIRKQGFEIYLDSMLVGTVSGSDDYVIDLIDDPTNVTDNYSYYYLDLSQIDFSLRNQTYDFSDVIVKKIQSEYSTSEDNTVCLFLVKHGSPVYSVGLFAPAFEKRYEVYLEPKFGDSSNAFTTTQSLGSVQVHNMFSINLNGSLKSFNSNTYTTIKPTAYRYDVYLDLYKLNGQTTAVEGTIEDYLIIRELSNIDTLPAKASNRGTVQGDVCLLCAFEDYELLPCGLLGYLTNKKIDKAPSALVLSGNGGFIKSLNVDDLNIYGPLQDNFTVNKVSSTSFSYTKITSIPGYKAYWVLPSKATYITISFDYEKEEGDPLQFAGFNGISGSTTAGEVLINVARSSTSGHEEATFAVDHFGLVGFYINNVSENRFQQISNLSILVSVLDARVTGDLNSTFNRNIDEYILNAVSSSRATVEVEDNTMTVTKLSSAPGARICWKLPDVYSLFNIEFDYTLVGGGSLEFNLFNGIDSNELKPIAVRTFESGHVKFEDSIMNATYLGISVNGLAIDATLTISNFTFNGIGIEEDSFGQNVLYNSIYKSTVKNTCVKFNALSELNRIGYIWISDMHFRTSQQENIQSQLRQVKAVCEIANSTAIDFVVIGGDIIDGESTITNVWDWMPGFINELSNCKKPIVFLSGNHDDNSYGTWFGKGVMKNILIDNTSVTNAVFPDTESCYYYFDIPTKDTKVICLDYIDYGANYQGRSWWSYSQKQIEWVCTTLLANTCKNIIILSHGCPDPRYGGAWNLGDEGGYTQDLIDVIGAYNSKSSVVKYGNTYNFASVSGSIINMHVGHTHYEPLVDIAFGNAPCIITSCAKATPVSDTFLEQIEAVPGEADTYIMADPEGAHWTFYDGFQFKYYVDRENKTIKEALFDVVSVNSTKITCLRVGCGEDREFDIV